MNEQKQEQWYTNKDLLQMQQELREELIELRTELRNTTEAVRRYNGLRERIDDTARRLDAHLLTGVGKADVARGIREWGGWIVGLIGVLAALVSRYG